MTERERQFGQLYGELAGTPRESALAAQRARLVLRQRSGDQSPVRSWPPFAELRLGLGLSVLAAVTGLALVLWQIVPGEAPMQARWQGAVAEIDAALVASQSPLPLDFSDGSQIVLEPSAVAKLEAVDAERTGLVLEKGRVSAKIKRSGERAWTIAAGPYRVKVTGTEFTVDWDRASGFRVAVRHGSVHVTGGDLPPSGVKLAAGQELARANPSESARVESAPPKGEPVYEVADLPVLPAEAPEEAEAAPALPRGLAAEPALPTAEPESWQRSAETGDYANALRLAEAAGFDGVLSTGTRAELLLLANAARYARSGQRAKQAYTAIRSRFAGTHAARLAAFYLARLAGDVERQPRNEVSWLRTYLSESPSGELSASARARLMELLRSLGDASGARAAASDYLRHHPSGPHAGVARSLLGQ